MPALPRIVVRELLLKGKNLCTVPLTGWSLSHTGDPSNTGYVTLLITSTVPVIALARDSGGDIWDTIIRLESQLPAGTTMRLGTTF